VHSNHPLAATEWNALAADSVIQQQTGPFRRCRGRGDFAVLRVDYLWQNIFSSNIFMVALWNKADHYFHAVVCSFFFFLA